MTQQKIWGQTIDKTMAKQAGMVETTRKQQFETAHCHPSCNLQDWSSMVVIYLLMENLIWFTLRR